ncbi:MAG: tetratricopeptide repeat protein [Armatimonadetes bacterium]|nr:tetratricopeptide repeat protein [Armatimonadota bacterium]
MQVTRPVTDCPDPACPMTAMGELAAQDTSLELAEANLHRMRREYGAARQACLAVLRKSPGDFVAHTLLGDISYEQDQIEEAKEWYELALDLRPDSVAERSKLDQITRRLEEQQAASTMKQLGIPIAKPKTRLVLAATAFFIIAVGLSGFFAGRVLRSDPGNGNSIPRQQAISIGNQPVAPPPTPDTKPEETKPEVPHPAPAQPTNEDTELLASLQGKIGAETDLLGAISDPRSATLTATFVPRDPGQVRSEALTLAGKLLAAQPGVAKVICRAMNTGRLIYIGELDRAALDSSGNPTEPMKNEWPSQPAPAPETPAETPAPEQPN